MLTTLNWASMLNVSVQLREDGVSCYKDIPSISWQMYPAVLANTAVLLFLEVLVCMLNMKDGKMTSHKGIYSVVHRTILQSALYENRKRFHCQLPSQHILLNPNDYVHRVRCYVLHSGNNPIVFDRRFAWLGMPRSSPWWLFNRVHEKLPSVLEPDWHILQMYC